MAPGTISPGTLVGKTRCDRGRAKQPGNSGWRLRPLSIDEFGLWGREESMYPVEVVRTSTQLYTNAFIRSVYNWMAVGLILTGGTAYYVANNEVLLQSILGNRPVFFGLLISELILVIYLISRVKKMSASTATGLFLLYSALNGVTFSILLMLFSRESIAAAFFISAGTFITCSIYSMKTRQDLTSLGAFGTMGLIGIIIASIVNLFFGSSGISIIINYVGVIVFVALTAYDTQKLKKMALSQPVGLDAGTIRKGAIIGALTLYLDFINLFIILLHVVGGSRE
jgi:FtsH-binding integral membrane protein